MVLFDSNICKKWRCIAFLSSFHMSYYCNSYLFQHHLHYYYCCQYSCILIVVLWSSLLRRYSAIIRSKYDSFLVAVFSNILIVLPSAQQWCLPAGDTHDGLRRARARGAGPRPRPRPPAAAARGPRLGRGAVPTPCHVGHVSADCPQNGCFFCRFSMLNILHILELLSWSFHFWNNLAYCLKLLFLDLSLRPPTGKSENIRSKLSCKKPKSNPLKKDPFRVFSTMDPKN